ncbi:hypothetical protein NW752_000201 [Fusarium irregulare]|uniref:Uncharacterized protein n=1 Tax=Fusarium irregulare TaxID=2494466 RepID=A0A9W8UFC6_9HYPO|nr:hypothetical protein NW766_001634 [Fusarium irregulare]KAJ4027950.1 hypothetical protein NW752_000201 [Fusarium irregulare]
MSSNKTSQALKAEVSKLARLSNVQGGLPPLIRGLPVIALMAGEAISKATNSLNSIEERLLGADEAVVLQPPSTAIITTGVVPGGHGRPGVSMMCQACGVNMDTSYKLPVSATLERRVF